MKKGLKNVGSGKKNLAKYAATVGVFAMTAGPALADYVATDYSTIQTNAEAELAAVKPVAIAIAIAVLLVGFSLKLIKRFGKG